MTTPMKKHAHSFDLDPPGPVAGLLEAGGYDARLVVSRKDGQPMTEADQKEATWLIEESEKRELSDEEIARRGRAYLDKQTTSSAKPAAKGKKRSPRAAE